MLLIIILALVAVAWLALVLVLLTLCHMAALGDAVQHPRRPAALPLRSSA